MPCAITLPISSATTHARITMMIVVFRIPDAADRIVAFGTMLATVIPVVPIGETESR